MIKRISDFLRGTSKNLTEVFRGSLNKYMNINKLLKSEKSIYIILFIITFFIVINSTYSPVNFRRMHIDSSVYTTIAQGITRGHLPYLDFVDNKGPLTYLFSAFGLLIGGFTGLWLLELLFIFVTVIFAYKTALFFANKQIALLGTALSLCAFYTFFTINAGTEGYALPFLTISFYIVTKYFFSEKQNTSFLDIFIFGACFACAVLCKQSMFALWFGFCFIIFIDLIIKKQFLNLIKYFVGFLLGIIIIFIPVLLYLQINGIFNVFIDQYLFAGYKHGFASPSLKGIFQNIYAVLNRSLTFIPFFVCVFWIITRFKQKEYKYYFGFILSYLFFILNFSLSFGGTHHNMVLLPYFVPCFVFLADIIITYFDKLKIKRIFIFLFFIVVFSEGLINYLYDTSKILFNNSGQKLKQAGKMIDENTNQGDKIISLGTNAYIYLFTQREAASRYIFQGVGLNHIPGANKEFISDILTNKPKIIAAFYDDHVEYNYEAAWHEPVYELINSDYELLSSENGFNLYIRIN